VKFIRLMYATIFEWIHCFLQKMIVKVCRHVQTTRQLNANLKKTWKNLKKSLYTACLGYFSVFKYN